MILNRAASSVFRNLKSLTSLDLSDLPQLTDSFLGSQDENNNLVNENEGLPRLSRLMLDGTSLSNSSVKVIVGKCPQLSELWLFDGVTDEGVCELVEGLPMLTDLFFGKSSITNSSLKELKKCRFLSHLDVQQCALLTAEGIWFVFDLI
jgi:hypothetical protein